MRVHSMIVKMEMDSLMKELSGRVGCEIGPMRLAYAMADAYIAKAMREGRSVKQMAAHLERYVRAGLSTK